MRHPDRHLRLAAGAVLLGALWLHPWAAAQDDPRALGSAGIPPGGRFAGHSVTDFPRVRHLVERAERDVAEGLYDAAFEAIQEVIDRYPNQIYHAPDGIYHGARQYCIGILGGLPPEGRAAYRARYDRAAGRLFRRAAAEQDLEGLHEIVRRFLFTSWGPKALERLARLYHERGEWEEAAYYYRRAIEARGDEAPSPEALVRIATCLARAGDLEGARAAAERIARIAPDARVRVAGKDEAAGASARGILERARKRAALPPPGDAWPQLAGDPTHTRLAPPYPGPWTNGNVVPLGFPLLEPTTDRRVFMTRRFLPDISDMPPPFQPVIDGAVAFVHDGLLLEAINLYNGKRKWEYASLDEPTALPHPRITFAAACAGGVVYAPLETHVDEELIDYNYTPIRLPLPRRKLHAFDEETGTLLWSHADPPAAPPPPRERAFLERSSVCTPPLVWRERLYVGASYFEGKIHSYVCCFDRRTGNLLWKTLVCTGQQELNMFGNQFMEYVASPLALEGGEIYYVTNLGLVASLDARAGTIRWISEYPIVPLPTSQGFHPEIRDPSWYRNPPILTDELLVTTPLDSEELLAVDRATGKIRWSLDRLEGGKIPRRRLYTLGLEGPLLLVAGTAMEALDARTGAEVWVEPFNNDDEEATGSGLVARGSVLVPTQYGLYARDTRTGKLLFDPVPWEHGMIQAGNLVSIDDFLVSSSPTTLSIYVRWDEICARLRRELEAHPEDVDVHLRLGDGYAHAGELPPALDHYEQAFRLTLDDPAAAEEHLRAKKGLYNAYRDRGVEAEAAGRPAQAEEHYRTALRFAWDDRSLVRGYLKFETLYGSTSRYDRLRSLYEEMLAKIPRARFSFEGAPSPYPAGLYALVNLAKLDVRDRMGGKAVERYEGILRDYAPWEYRGIPGAEFAKNQIDFVIRTFGPGVYAPFEKEASRLLEEARATRDPKRFEEVLRLYPNSGRIEACLLEYSVVLQQEGRYREALAKLRGFLIDFPGSGLRDTVLGEIVTCYDALGLEDAAAYVAGLREKEGPAGEGTPARAAAAEPPPPSRRNRTAPFREVWKRTFSREGTVEFVEIVGGPLPFFDDHVVLKGTRNLFCLDLENREIVWRRDDLALPTDPALLVEDRRGYVTTYNGRVVCLDPATGRDIWTRELPGRVYDTVLAPGTLMVVIRRGAANRSTFRVLGLDALSGRTVWSRGIAGQYQRRAVPAFGRVLLRTASSPGRAFALESFTGEIVWDSPVERNSQDPIPLDRSRVVLAATTTTLRCVDLDRRAEIWSYDRAGSRLKFVYGAGDAVVVRTRDALDLVDAATGRSRWSLEFSDEEGLERVRGLEGPAPDLLVFKLGDRGGRNALVALRAADGSELWRHPLPRDPLYLKRAHRRGSTLILETTQYHPESRIRILLVDRDTGAEIQTLEYDGNYRSDVSIRGRYLAIVTGNRLHLYLQTQE